MHFLDLFWGAQKHHKIDPNSLRFFWHVTRRVSMFYSKSVKTELQDSVKCAKNFEVPRKDIFSVRHEPNRKFFRFMLIHFVENLLFSGSFIALFIREICGQSKSFVEIQVLHGLDKNRDLDQSWSTNLGQFWERKKITRFVGAGLQAEFLD